MGVSRSRVVGLGVGVGLGVVGDDWEGIGRGGIGAEGERRDSTVCKCIRFICTLMLSLVLLSSFSRRLSSLVRGFTQDRSGSLLPRVTPGRTRCLRAREAATMVVKGVSVRSERFATLSAHL